MRIYISGPMTGLKDLNKPAFYAKERQLRELQYNNVKNPAHIEGLVGAGKPYAAYFAVAVKWLLECDALVYVDAQYPLLSKGCYTETLLAEGLGMPLLFCRPDGLYKVLRDKITLIIAEKTDNPLLF